MIQAIFVSMIIFGCKQSTFSSFENIDFYILLPSKLFETVFIMISQSEY